MSIFKYRLYGEKGVQYTSHAVSHRCICQTNQHRINQSINQSVQHEIDFVLLIPDRNQSTTNLQPLESESSYILFNTICMKPLFGQFFNPK